MVVNQSFVRRFFPGEQPLGRQFGIGRDQIVTAAYEIVGVVSDARYRSFREPFQPTLFSCLCGARSGDSVFQLEVRSAGRPESVIASVESADAPDRSAPALPRSSHHAQRRGRFALGGAHTGGRGQRPFAARGTDRLRRPLRPAFLHASRSAARRSPFASHSARARPISAAPPCGVLAITPVTGAALGIAAAVPAARLIGSVLFEVRPTDWLEHTSAVAMMLLAGLVAAARPAWRASRVDPWDALRGN